MNNCQRIGLILGVVFTLVILNSFALAQDIVDQQRRAVLRGLQGCAVGVANLGPEIEQEGLTTKQLQTDTELKFRLAGIKVLPWEERFKTIGAPSFSLNVLVMKLSSSRGYISSIRVCLMEWVRLQRNGDMVWATTWETPNLMIVAPKLTNIRQAAKDMVDEFINDYLAANPK